MPLSYQVVYIEGIASPKVRGSSGVEVEWLIARGAL